MSHSHSLYTSINEKVDPIACDSVPLRQTLKYSCAKISTTRFETNSPAQSLSASRRRPFHHRPYTICERGEYPLRNRSGTPRLWTQPVCSVHRLARHALAHRVPFLKRECLKQYGKSYNFRGALNAQGIGRESFEEKSFSLHSKTRRCSLLFESSSHLLLPILFSTTRMQRSSAPQKKGCTAEL